MAPGIESRSSDAVRTVYRLPFRILDIPVQIDLSFLLILPVLAWIIGSQLQQLIAAFAMDIDPDPLTRGITPYLLGLVAALGLFLSVLIHELGHSVVGRMFNLRIRSITLWILGGMAQFERIPRKRGTEAVMAIAGPITSLMVGALSGTLLWMTPHDMGGTRFVLAYLMFMNFILVAFNMLPALPLDGGRVFRSLLAMRIPYLRATQVAVSVSRFLAIALGLFGFLTVNIWFILMAFFIYIAVGGESQYATVSTVLRGIAVGDVMTRDVRTVRDDVSVAELIQRMFQERYLTLPVLDGSERLVGLVTLQDVRKVRAQGWDENSRTVGEIMSRKLEQIREHQSALDAFQRISRSESGRLLVTGQGGELRGIISKTDLVRAIQLRTVETELEE
jgi:Zn-dependent protease/CBS domain-containing protein